MKYTHPCTRKWYGMGSIMIIRRYKCLPISLDAKKGCREEGFLQVCTGPAMEKELALISDALSPLRKSIYKLCCNCQQCISYSYEATSQKMFTEPFMKAINLVFNFLVKSDYSLQSTSTAQNADGSTTTTWVWIKEHSSAV